MKRNRSRLSVLAAPTAVALAASALVLSGVAAVPQRAYAEAGATVSLRPSPVTPFLLSRQSTVAQLAACGSMIYAVGTFTRIGTPDGRTYNRRNAFAFDATTGAVSGWDPEPDGPVASVALSSRCGKVYLAGSFNRVGTQDRPGLVKVNNTTGAVYTRFQPRPDKPVSAVVRIGKHIVVGGSFSSIGGASRTAMASLRRATGTATSYLHLSVTGQLPGDSGRTRIYKFEISPSGKRMVAMGNFAAIDGHARTQAFILKINKSPVILSDWSSPAFALPCDPLEARYVRAAAWSPDSRRVYIATTGNKGRSPLCDAVAAFSGSSRSDHPPLWINKTGCDSLYAVAADAGSVYIGGHERYIDNPNGCDVLGPGGKLRLGIGAVSPTTGQSQPWNPTRARGHGADDLLRTSAGLWIASDNFFDAANCAGVYHPGICFFPNG